MSETVLTIHPDCVEVARIVAAEVASIEQAFARRAAKVLREMKPSTDHHLDRVFGRGVEVSARTLLVLAGLPADGVGPLPERNGTVLNAPERSRTETNE